MIICKRPFHNRRITPSLRLFYPRTRSLPTFHAFEKIPSFSLESLLSNWQATKSIPVSSMKIPSIYSSSIASPVYRDHMQLLHCELLDPHLYQSIPQGSQASSDYTINRRLIKHYEQLDSGIPILLCTRIFPEDTSNPLWHYQVVGKTMRQCEIRWYVRCKGPAGYPPSRPGSSYHSEWGFSCGIQTRFFCCC